jgi:hypothetical protein
LSLVELRGWLAVERIRANPKPEQTEPITLEQARASMKKSIRHAKT